MWRAPTDAVVSFLEQTAVLGPCAPQILARIAPHVEQREVPKGQPILVPGLATTGLGFLFAGKASLRMTNALSGTEVKLEDVLPGNAFGEIGLLLTGVNPLSVVAEEECRVLLLRKEHFEQILNGVPGVAQAIARGVSARFAKLLILGLSQGGAAPAAVPAPPAGGEPPLKKGEHRFVEVSAFNLTPKLLDLLPARVVQQQRVLPLELREKSLLVGMVNPASEEARQEVERCLQTLDPELVAISIDDFNSALVRHKLDLGGAAQASGPGKPFVKPIHGVEHRKEADKGANLVMGEEVINLVDRVMVEALERGASDIHIEPEPSGVRVRYRIQGMLVDRREIIPPSFAAGVAARIKILSELDITERRVPQDGRIASTIGKRELSFRVSTLATGRGEKIVMRILDPMDVMRPLDHIFLDPRMIEVVNRAIAAPHGAIFVAGPTGSGKSSTLYSMLNQRRAARPDNNIVTVEDPVEFSFPGITQTPINPKIGLDYPTALRALMRQDPDVIMVGELRDQVSTSIAIEAALTGHLVLTSIHGSTCTTVLQRLGHFGIAPVLLSQALNVIVVQRLAPRMCPQCVREEDLSPAMIENLQALHLIDKMAGAIRLPRPVGCENCDRTGRKGRVPLVEILSLQEDMRAVLASGAPPAELLSKAAASNQFVPFVRYARLLMARKLLAPADAIHVVAE